MMESEVKETKDESKSLLSIVDDINKILNASSNLTDKDLSELNPLLAKLTVDVKNRTWIYSTVLGKLFPLVKYLFNTCQSMSDLSTKSVDQETNSKEENGSPEVDQSSKNFSEFQKNVMELKNYVGKFKQTNISFKLEELAKIKKSEKMQEKLSSKTIASNKNQGTIQLADMPIPIDVIRIILDFVINATNKDEPINSKLNISLVCKTFNNIIKELKLNLFDFNPEKEIKNNDYSIAVIDDDLTNEEILQTLQTFNDKNTTRVLNEFAEIKTNQLNKVENKLKNRLLTLLLSAFCCVLILAIPALVIKVLVFPNSKLSDAEANTAVFIAIGITLMLFGVSTIPYLRSSCRSTQWDFQRDKTINEYSNLLANGSAPLLTSPVGFYGATNTSIQNPNSNSSDRVVEIADSDSEDEQKIKDKIISNQDYSSIPKG